MMMVLVSHRKGSAIAEVVGKDGCFRLRTVQLINQVLRRKWLPLGCTCKRKQLLMVTLKQIGNPCNVKAKTCRVR